MILAGDIGGTKTNIALFAADDPAPRPRLLREESFRSLDYPGLEQILTQFLGSDTSQLSAACFGVAGPIVEQRSQIPNLPWVIDARSLTQTLGLPSVTLINDLEATAEGIGALGTDELETLNVGSQGAGLEVGAVIAAGTGLGMAILQPASGQWIPVASEGGHMDFAPRNDLEMDLLRFLLTRHARVSTERVVSGPGLLAVYDFIAQRPLARPNPQIQATIVADAAEAPRAISNAALAAQCPVCVDAVNLWLDAYGAAAGNLGLLAFSTGGMFLGGGIAPKMLAQLKAGRFMTAFTHKGRLSPVLERMPVHVILNPKAPLLGAARRARRLVS